MGYKSILKEGDSLIKINAESTPSEHYTIVN